MKALFVTTRNVLRLAIASLVGVGAAAQDAGWTHTTLDGGVHLSVLHVPDAPRQSSFVFLPLGLSLDEAHRTQFAHLIEHMLIRQVDPEGMVVDGIEINGETSAELLRLEAIAPPDKWRDALSHQVRWVTTRKFEDDELEREKAAMARELDTTVASGYTHKWAQAAWNQIVNHGLDHAAVYADVLDATVEQVRDYVARRVRIDDRVHFVAVGPAAAEEVARTLAAALSASPAPKPEVAPVAKPAPETVTSRDRTATWDLPIRHYLEFYEVPDESSVDRATSWILASSLFQRLVQHADLTRRGVRVHASADLVGRGRRYLALSASLPGDVDVEIVKKAFAEVVEGMLRPRLGGVDPEMLARQAALQVERVPDFALQRKLLSGHPRGDWLEANAALQIVLHALRLGLPIGQAAEPYRAVTRERVTDLLEKALTPERRNTLLLTPRAR